MPAVTERTRTTMMDLATYTPMGDKKNSDFFEEYLPRVYERRAQSGLNEIVMLGGVVSLVAAVAALWLVRERDIERDAPIELPEPPITPEGQPALQPTAA